MTVKVDTMVDIQMIFVEGMEHGAQYAWLLCIMINGLIYSKIMCRHFCRVL